MKRRRSFIARRRTRRVSGGRRASFKRAAPKRKSVVRSRLRRRASKYTRITGANSIPHYVHDRPKDRQHYILTSKFEGKMLWLPLQIGALGSLQDHGDGFVISMNAMANPWGLVGRGVTQGGVPTAALPSGSGVWFERWNTSGFQPDIPDGLATMMVRYTYAVVTHGVFRIRIFEDSYRQDENKTNVTGSTQLAVCSIPASATLAGSYVTGHVVYPPQTAFGSTGNALDEASFAAVSAEPNVKKTYLSPSTGSQTIAHIVYPFNMNKIAPPGYWTSGSFFQSTPINTGNPTYNLQPDILVQFITDSSLQKTYRVEMTMTWHCTAFERRLVNNIG